MSDKRIFQGTITQKGVSLSRYENQQGGLSVNTHYKMGDTILLNQAEVDYYVTELGHVELPMAPVPFVAPKNPGGVFAAEPNQDNNESTQKDKGSADSKLHEGAADDQGDTDTEVGESPEVDSEVVDWKTHWTAAFDFTPGVLKALRDSGMTQDETADSTMTELVAIRGIGAKAGRKILDFLNPYEPPVDKDPVNEDTADDLLS